MNAARDQVERMAELYRDDDRIEHLRVPPQDVRAEQSVLGGVMLSPKALWLIREMLSEEDFYRRDHRLIFRAILALDDQHQPFDAVTLGAWLESKGLADQIGGSGYLNELAMATPSAANIKAYAKIVREKSMLRHLIEAGTEIVNEGFQPEGRGAMEVLASAQGRLGRVLMSEPSELESPSPILRRLMDKAQAASEGDGGFEGLTTGIPELDEIICGLREGQLIIVAGRPKMGKTTLARGIGEHVAMDLRKRVAIHSLEMQPEELIAAACCSRGRIDHDAVRRWQLDDMQWAAFSAASAEVGKAPLVLSRPRSVRVEQLVAQTRRAHAESPLSLVIIDYLQLIATSGDNRAQAIGDITRALKLLAGDIKAPVILLSQLNRDLERRPNKRPMPADLRDSGAIEQDADAVIFVYRDEVYDPQSPDRGTAEVIVGLQRGGKTGTARVLSRLDICRFEPLPLDWSGPPPLQHSERSASAPKPRKRGFAGRANGRDRAAGDD